MSTEPRIYVASLADYNSGRLHGRWIDVAGKTAEEIQEEVQEMLRASKEPIAEEWAIHDHEGLGDIGEFTSFDTIAAIAEKVEEHGDAFLAWLSYERREPDYFDNFEDQYLGEWDSFEVYAQELAEDCGMIDPDAGWPNSYIDWERAARDLMMDGYFTVPSGAPNYGVYVFDPNR